jgi:hypothetical protein
VSSIFAVTGKTAPRRETSVCGDAVPPVRSRRSTTLCVVMLVFAATLSGCSNTFLYNRLNWLIPWYLDDYVDLSGQQSRALREDLKGFLSWHRQNELPYYLQILDEIEVELKEDIDGSDVNRWIGFLIEAYERVEKGAMDWIIELGESLTEEQVSDFYQRLLDKQFAFERRYMARTDGEYLSEHRDNLAEVLAHFLGPLQDAQIQRLDSAVARLLRFDLLWLEDRGFWLNQLGGILKREPGWEVKLTQTLAGRKKNRTRAYQQTFQHNRSVISEAIADIINRRTPEQDDTLGKILRDYRRDLQKLIDKTPPETRPRPR